MPNWVDAGAGADVVKTGVSQDYLYGSSGDDVLDGGPGADMIAGGDGHDRADYSARTAPVVVTLDGAAGDGEAGENDKLTYSVEDVTGGAAADRLTGGSGANVFSGSGGNDALSGGAGDDVLDGGAGKGPARRGCGQRRAAQRRRSPTDRCGAGSGHGVRGCERTRSQPIASRHPGAPGTATPGAGATLDLLPSVIRLTAAGALRVRIYCGIVRRRLHRAGQRASAEDEAGGLPEPRRVHGVR